MAPNKSFERSSCRPVTPHAEQAAHQSRGDAISIISVRTSRDDEVALYEG